MACAILAQIYEISELTHMKESLVTKLETLCARHEEIAGLLSSIEVINNQDRFRNLSMESA